MTWRTLLPAAALLAAAGCGKPYQTDYLQNDQTVEVTNNNPGWALTIPAREVEYEFEATLSSDHIFDASFVHGVTANDAIYKHRHSVAVNSKDITKYSGKKEYVVQMKVAAGTPAVLVVYQNLTSAKAVVRVKRTK